MVQDTMDSGETEWQMDKVDLFMLKVTFMRENGLMIKLMDMAFTLILTEVDMRVNGTKINNMVSELNNGQTAPSMKDNMNKE